MISQQKAPAMWLICRVSLRPGLDIDQMTCEGSDEAWSRMHGVVVNHSHQHVCTVVADVVVAVMLLVMLSLFCFLPQQSGLHQPVLFNLFIYIYIYILHVNFN